MDRTRKAERRGAALTRALARASASYLLASASLTFAQAAPAPKPSESKAPVPDSGTYVVRDGDTMWDLSGRYFPSSYEWPRLWSYNPEITNPHWIYPGHVMRLEEGAQGGYSVEGVAAGDEAPGSSELLTSKGRFGQGFGAERFARSKDGSILVGEEVYLDRQALDQAAFIVGSYEDHMMLSPSDEVYLKFEGDKAPRAGRELTVFRHITKGENSATAGKVPQVMAGNEKGEIVRVLGAVRVKTYDEDTRIARAVITEALEPIERGFQVTDVPRKLAQVPPRTNARKVEAKIIAASRPLGVLGHNQIVFIGAGEKQGVQVGNRFIVVRQGDSWRRSLVLLSEVKTPAERPSRRKPDDSKYPEEPIGEVRVLYVRPESCTGIITGSVHEIEPGDRVEMPEGF